MTQQQFEILGEIPEREEEVVLLDLIEATPEKHDATLASLLERQGQLYPVLLHTDELGPPFRITDGRRRIAALRALGHKSVRAYVMTANEARAASITLTANAVRSANPLAEYAAIRSLFAAGMSEDEVTRATGMGKQTIRARMKLDRTPSAILDGVASGKVSVTVAERVATLPEATKERLVTYYAENEKLPMNVVDTERQAVRQNAGAALFETLPEVPRFNPWDQVISALDVALAGLSLCPINEARNMIRTLRRYRTKAEQLGNREKE